MKISYKVLKKYIENIKSAEEVSKDLVMHTAEVEWIISEKNKFNNIVYWKIKTINNHENADSLKVCMVDIWEDKEIQIVCWGSNLEIWQGVAVAKIWASVIWHWEWEPVIMKKTAIRWVESNWMICASEEIWLKNDFPAKDEKEILDISFIEAKTWTRIDQALKKDDEILEIDNKAINHRPDLFSHIWIIREIKTINWEKFDYNYDYVELNNLKDLWITNEIQSVVTRYIWVEVDNVENIESPEYIKDVLNSAWVVSKWLLIDLSNYSLYLYWQPTHCFDADKISWKITIRYAEKWEKFIALNDNEYELDEKDIVIADEKEILALWWIIWWKKSAVSNITKRIIIESANFNQSVVRKTWKRLWIRTDSLNVFEKDIVNDLQIHWASLIINELDKNLKNIKIISYTDIYNNKQKKVEIDYDLNFFTRLIWKNYEESEVLNILYNLWIEKKWDKLLIPFWRKDLNFKADIAEEIARITWYDNIESKIPEINMGAVTQDNIYKVKLDSRNYLTSIWFYDMYTYSFVNEELMNKCLSNTQDLILMKNALSEELTHLRWSLIPNLLLSLEKNYLQFPNLMLFELEKVFKLQNKSTVIENYNLSGVITSENEIAYYEIQNIVSNLLKSLWVLNFSYDSDDNYEKYSHKWRTAKINVRWNKIWTVWEINPKVAKNFEIEKRIWFFEINIQKIEESLYQTVKAKDISNFQENNFDLNFVVEKNTKWSKLKETITKSNTDIIKKVELIDIYENKEKLWDKKSYTYKIYIQSMEKTLDDKDKSELIKDIIKNMSKIWAELR